MSDAPWLEIWTAVYAVATVLVLVILSFTAGYAWRQVNYLKDQVESARRRIRLDGLDRLSNQWESKLLREARRLANQSGSSHKLEKDLTKYDSKNAKELYTIVALSNFFEEMGLLVEEGQLDSDDVANRFRPSIIYYHDLFSGYIKSGQQENKDHLVNFDLLAAKMACRGSSEP